MDTQTWTAQPANAICVQAALSTARQKSVPQKFLTPYDYPGNFHKKTEDLNK